MRMTCTVPDISKRKTVVPGEFLQKAKLEAECQGCMCLACRLCVLDNATSVFGAGQLDVIPRLRCSVSTNTPSGRR